MGLYQCLLSESAIQIGKAPFASQEEEYKRVLRGMRPPVRIASYAAFAFASHYLTVVSLFGSAWGPGPPYRVPLFLRRTPFPNGHSS